MPHHGFPGKNEKGAFLLVFTLKGAFLLNALGRIFADFQQISMASAQGNRIIKSLKKKEKMTTGRGIIDIRTSLLIIPDPRIERCKSIC
jgi:hypothetical protein